MSGDDKNPFLRETELLIRRARLHENPPDDLLQAILEDFESLRILDQEARGEDSYIRELYLLACDRHREKGRCFRGYLHILLRRHELPMETAAEMSGVTESTLMDWLVGDAMPDYELVKTFVEALPVKYIEAIRLLGLLSELEFLVDFPEARYRSMSFEQKMLLRERPAGDETFGDHLELGRTLSVCFVEEIAELTYVSEDLWRAWEQGHSLPTFREVEVLGYLLYSTDRARKVLHEAWEVSVRKLGAA